jgi:PAS domain S-box-containing protein
MIQLNLHMPGTHLDRTWEECAATAPAGFSESGKVLARARRLAVGLFADRVDAHITLITPEADWHTFGHRGPITEGLRRLRDDLRRGVAVWVEDCLLDDRFAAWPKVHGPPHARFFASAPIRLRDGVIVGALCVFGFAARPADPNVAGRLQDIADFVSDEWSRVKAQRAELAMASENAQTRAVLAAFIDSSPITLLMLDRELRLMQCSQRWLQHWRLDWAEVQGKHLFEVVPESAQAGDAYDRCLAGENLRLPRTRVVRRDGTILWVQSEFTPWRSVDGAVGGVLIGSHDITEVVDALEASERTERWLKLALEISDTYVFDVDFDTGRYLKAGQEETFYDVEHAPQDMESARRLLDPRDLAHMDAFWAAGPTLEPFRGEFRTPRADGREVWAQASLRAVPNESGHVGRIVGALQNVTERKQAEAALRASMEQAEAATRAKSAFLATMSHEIRTPLNGVLGMAQAMERDELSARQRDRLEVIRQSGEALLAILNDVLDLSKIEAGKLVLEEAEFDIDQLAQGAHGTFSATAQAKGLEFDLHISPEARGAYVGDTVRVRQILYNLVSNALKFTEHGQVKVEVTRSRGTLVLTVADSGIGVSQEKLARLFDKFEQADASTTRRYGGTGLGLAICRDLTQLMGGSIEARSELGHGATFIVRLPLRKLRRPARAMASLPQTPEPSLEGRALRVLAAEDNPMNQLVLRTVLEQIGVTPTVVDDGAAAVEAWQTGDWDLVLMDVQMPRLDGPAATREIRAREIAQGRRRTPIVALTANAMDHQVRDYREAGMDDFLAKPIQAAKLFQVVLAAAQAAEPDARVQSAAA